MKVNRFTVNAFAENVYILWDEKSHQAMVIDPGMMRDGEREVVTRFIDEQELTVSDVLVTHVHVDHVASAEWLVNHCNAHLWWPHSDCECNNRLLEQVSRFGLKLDLAPLPEANDLTPDASLDLAGEPVKVLPMPGHSPGGVAFYCPHSSILFSGDSIFQGSIGRTDFIGGDFVTLLHSIETQVMTLPDDTLILAGHGAPTTVLDERRSNPFLSRH